MTKAKCFPLLFRGQECNCKWEGASESAEYIKDEGASVDSICSAVLMFGRLEPRRKILNAKFSVSFISEREQARSLLLPYTYCYHRPHNDGMKCAWGNAKLQMCVCPCVGVCEWERGLVIDQRQPVLVHKARPDVKQKPDPWTERNGPSFDLTSPNIKDVTLNTYTSVLTHACADVQER